MTTTNDSSVAYFLQSIIVINTVMALLASSLNFLTIFTFVKTSSLREKPSNVLVLGLAIADFSAGVIAQPAFVSWNIYIFLSSDDKLETTQEIVLRVFHSISNVILLVSFLNIIAITADRFLAVYLHLRYQELVTTKRCGIALACIWVFCLAFNVATSSLMLVSYEGYIVFLTLYIALGVINIFLLVKISRVIRRHSVQIQAQQQSLQQSIDMPRYKKSVKTMYYVSGAFLFSFIASVAFHILRLCFQNVWVKNKMFLDGGIWTFVMLNSVLNPIIYCMRVGEIRTAIGTLLRRPVG